MMIPPVATFFIGFFSCLIIIITGLCVCYCFCRESDDSDMDSGMDSSMEEEILRLDQERQRVALQNEIQNQIRREFAPVLRVVDELRQERQNHGFIRQDFI